MSENSYTMDRKRLNDVKFYITLLYKKQGLLGKFHHYSHQEFWNLGQTKYHLLDQVISIEDYSLLNQLL